MKNKTPFCSLRAFLLAAAIITGPAQLSAASLTWDITPGDGAAITDGGGTWSDGTGNWNDGTTDATWNNTTPDSAIFTGATGGAISVSGGVTQAGMSFNGDADHTLSGGGIGGAGGLTKNGAGILTLIGANTYSGDTTVSAGTLKINSQGATGTGSIILGDANTGASNLGLDLSNFPAWAATFSPPVTVANEGTGAVTITLGVANVVTRNTFTLNRPTTFVANNTGTTYVGANFGVNAGGLVTGNVGTLTLTQNGTGTIAWGHNGPNTYTGATVITAGRVTTFSNGALGGGGNPLVLQGTAHLLMNAGGLTVGNLSGASAAKIGTEGGARTLTIDQIGDSEFAGTLEGAVSLTKTGGGTLTLSGNANHSGTTKVSAGTLAVKGTLAGALTVEASGTFAPGGDDIALLTGDGTMTLEGTVVMNIHKAGATLTSDEIAGSGALNLTGTLTVTATGDELAVGDTFTLLSNTGVRSVSATLNLPPLPAGLAWNFSALETSGTITVGDTLSPPLFNPPAGSYLGTPSVTISAESGSTIYYTVNGSQPTAGSPNGPSPVSLVLPAETTNYTIKAFASKDGIDSTVTTAIYTTVASTYWAVDEDGDWSDPAKWLNGVVAGGIGTTADFNTTPQTAPSTVTLDSNRTVGRIIFGNVNGFPWTLNGLGGSILTLATTAGQPEIEVVNETATIAAPLAGNQGLVKSGAGILALNGANTYSGGATVSAGTLKVNRVDATGTGSITLGDANTDSNDVELDLSGFPVWPATFSPPVAVANEGTGGMTIRLGGANVVTNGTFTLNRPTTFVANNTGTTYVGANFAGSGLVTGNVGTLTLTQNGTGTIAWGHNGPNTYTGATVITAGRVTTFSNGAFGGGGNPLVLQGTARLDLDNNASGGVLTIGNLTGEVGTTISTTAFAGGGARSLIINQTGDTEFAGAITQAQPAQAPTLTKTGAGTLTVSGWHDHRGGTVIEEGAMRYAFDSLKLFMPAANGVVNGVTGDGTVSFNGRFEVNTTGADLTDGNSWLLVDTDTLTVSFGDDFQVDGFNETSPGVWTLEDDPRTWTFSQATGRLELAVEGYAGWVAGYFPGETDPAIIGPDADPDGDGLPNGIEFLTGSAPNDRLSSNAPEIVSAANGDMVVTFQRVESAKAHTVVVEQSTTLEAGSWTTITVPNDEITGPPVTVIDNGINPDDITVVIPAAGAARRFARVGIVID